MASLEFESVVLRLREGDDVGVLKKTVKGGTELANGELKLTTAVTIPAGHKIALRAVADGETVRKYGQIIGFAKGDVVPGEHVHSHNLVMKPYEREHSFCADYSATTPPSCGVTFWPHFLPEGQQSRLAPMLCSEKRWHFKISNWFYLMNSKDLVCAKNPL